jgi:hypothetical protein
MQCRSTKLESSTPRNTLNAKPTTFIEPTILGLALRITWIRQLQTRHALIMLVVARVVEYTLIIRIVTTHTQMPPTVMCHSRDHANYNSNYTSFPESC